MYEVYTPTAQEAAGLAGQNQMWLGEHGKHERFSRDPALEAPHVYIYPLLDDVWERERSWVARITGVGEDWSLQREFLPRRWIRGAHEEYMVYTLERGALYEIECALMEPMVERRGTHRIYLKCEEELDGFVVLGREAFMEEMRRARAADFGEVRALVSEEKWAMARRAATWLATQRENEVATDYVEQSYQRWLKELPALQGSKEHVRWARALREKVLSRWPEIARELLEQREDAAQRMPREALDALRAWLLGKQSAMFWIEHREVLTGQALWEIYLLEQLSLED